MGGAWWLELKETREIACCTYLAHSLFKFLEREGTEPGGGSPVALGSKLLCVMQLPVIGCALYSFAL